VNEVTPAGFITISESNKDVSTSTVTAEEVQFRWLVPQVLARAHGGNCPDTCGRWEQKQLGNL